MQRTLHHPEPARPDRSGHIRRIHDVTVPGSDDVGLVLVLGGVPAGHFLLLHFEAANAGEDVQEEFSEQAIPGYLQIELVFKSLRDFSMSFLLVLLKTRLYLNYIRLLNNIKSRITLENNSNCKILRCKFYFKKCFFF